MHRDQFNVRPRPRQVVEPALEWTDDAIGTSRAFWKDDQRVTIAHRLRHVLHGGARREEGMLAARLSSFDQHGSKHPSGQISPEGGALPIVAAGDRTRAFA
jgi:hypothetical protein